MRIIKVIILLLAVIVSSCSSDKKSNAVQSETPTESHAENISAPQGESAHTTSSFDINSIAVSEEDLGEFPFFSMPEGLKEQNKPIQRKYDRLYFPIDGVMTPLEGKIWKSFVTPESGSYRDWSLVFFEKSYDDAITSVGGVKIFDGEISKDEYDRYHAQATYLGEEGSIGYTDENIKVYVIHREDGGDVYIQLSGNNAGGKINILQKEAFKQTITILKSDQIQKDLEEKGKAVLYINFDTDKATLKQEGKDAVAEISKALKADESLDVAINGYTDNTGSDEHNLQLSKDRAAAVLDALTSSGIEVSRLTSEGYGAKDPIADNNTEDGKAKNRRVELVKK